MKKNVFFAMLGFTTLLFATSCSKTDTPPNNTLTITGKWDGGWTNLGPSHSFTLNFKTGGAFAVDQNATAPSDLATGSWALGSDSVRASYTYLDGITGSFSIAGKVSADYKTIVGTLGTGSNTSGAGTFSVTKD